MTVCPFCKKAVVNPDGGPCPSCGKVPPSKRPAPMATGHLKGGGDSWGDDEIEHGSSGGAPAAASSYSGGSFGGLGDDDDNGPGLSLELDTPARPHSTPSSMAPRASGHSNAPARGSSGAQPAYGAEPMPQPLPPRSMKPASDPSMAGQQSTPNNLAPPSSPQVAPQHAQMPPPPVLGPPGPSDAAGMIARYPAPPAKIWQTPVYAIRVLLRQFELRQDIASLKKRRSPDVGLYERALKTHDGMNFVIGIALTCAALTLAMFVFFLPVILRFVRDPD